MPPTYIRPKEELLEVIRDSINMTDASRKLGVPFTTFRGWALKYGIYDPNPNQVKRLVERKSTGGLIHLLVARGLKEEICERCDLDDNWNGLPITLQIHHKDGNNKNNHIDNLEVLCPNCHSQTKTYCGRNVKNKQAPLV